MPAARIAALLLLMPVQDALAADLPDRRAEGWHSWRVEVVDAAPELCCFAWISGVAAQKRCNLDGRRGGFGTSGEQPFPSDELQIYAFLETGSATKIRVLSSQCPVSSDSPITDLGSVPADDSVAWLHRYFAPSSGVNDEAITAVALHAGDRARNLLLDTARSDADEDNRESAIFWMGQARIEDAAPELKQIMLEDRSPDIREHAAFSYSQSSAADRDTTLVRLGREDASAEVRSQAWFWLAQTGAASIEREILAALAAERDAEVREQAVFALSQLPEERAVRALAGVLEDRRLDLELREEALFWLAQTESDAAFEYVERLLTDN